MGSGGFSLTRMVDISEKKTVRRECIAEGRLRLKVETVQAIREGKTKKGDVLTASQIAGVQAAKRTSQLIPLCHQIPLSSVDVQLELEGSTVIARTTVIANYTTGVEIEALAGTTIALINVWDMVKYLEKDENGQYPTTEILSVRVIRKSKEED